MVPQRFQIRATLSHSAFEKESIVKMFHRWIQQAAVPGLLIDVADYLHVPDGPGVLLVGHEVDYGIVGDELVVTWKSRRMSNRDQIDSFHDVFGAAWQATNAAAEAMRHAPELNDPPPSIKQFDVIVLDRLLVPNGSDIPQSILDVVADVTQQDATVKSADDTRLPAAIGVKVLA